MTLFQGIRARHMYHDHDMHPAGLLLLLVSLLCVAGIFSSFLIPWDRKLVVFLQPFGDFGSGHMLSSLADCCGNGFYQAVAFMAVALVAGITGRKTIMNQMFMVIAAIAASGIAVNIIKFAVGRARPCQHLDNWYMVPFSLKNDFHSFPSGHTATSFAIAYIMSVFYPRLALLWYMGALLIGAGRVIGESHFPTDMMGGAVLGVATGWIMLTYFNPCHEGGKYSLKKNRRDSQDLFS